MVHPIRLGKNERMSYSQVDEVLEMPNLIEVQKIHTSGSSIRA